MNEWMSKMKNIILYGIITVCLRYNNHNMWMFWVIHSGTIFTHPRSLYYSVQPQSQTTPQADQSIPLILHFCGCAGMVGNAAIFSEMKQQLWLLTIVTTHICERNFFPLTLIFLSVFFVSWHDLWYAMRSPCTLILMFGLMSFLMKTPMKMK